MLSEDRCLVNNIILHCKWRILTEGEFSYTFDAWACGLQVFYF